MMLRRWWWIALSVFIADQASKYAVVKYLPGKDVAVMPLLNLVLAYNTGAAFGFLNRASGWQNVFFIAIAVVVSIVIVRMLRQLQPGQSWIAIALLLVLGGAFGNLLDRIRFGYVVDFIDFYIGTWHWYTFNLADSAISCGAVMLALDAFGLSARKKTA